jgi:RNA polymerase sigma factor (sigma-70 family)
MADGPLSDLIRRLRRVVAVGEAGLTDASLLDAFVRRRDEAAFEAIVRRHGALVLGTCRRVLRSHHDAEDAFQATFLVLALKATSITSRTSLSNWLYGVAYRTSLKAKLSAERRRRREGKADMRNPNLPADRDELQSLIDEELSRLPDKYRAVIVLCDLEGKTRRQAAEQFRCPEGTVAGRLARARTLLAKRLTQRGVVLSAAALAGHESLHIASAGVPASLIVSTSKAATLYAAGQTITGVVSSHVAALAAGVLQAMMVAKLKTFAFAAFAIGLAMIAGGGWLTHATTAAQVEPPKPPDVANKAVQADPKAKKNLPSDPPIGDDDEPKKDLFGDPLPRHALARLGTVRLRHGQQIRVLNFSPDGKTILSADWHGVHVWDAETGQHLRQFGDPKDNWQFQDIAASDDNRIVAISVSKGDIEIWDATTGRRLRQFQTGRFPRLRLSPDGMFLAVVDSGEGRGGEKHALRLFNTATGKEHHRFPDQQRHDFFAFTKDGKTFLHSCDDNTIRFWDIGAGKQLRQVSHSAPNGQMIVSPDLRHLATVAQTKHEGMGQGGGSFVLWLNTDRIELRDLETGKVLHQTAEHKNGDHPAAYPLTFTPDGQMLLSTDGKTLRWWDAATGKEMLERNVPAFWTQVVAFSSDGKTLAIGGSGATIQLWDLQARKLKFSPGPQGPIHGTAVSPDGKTYATTGAADPFIRLWDAQSGKEIGKFAGFERGGMRLAFTPDGAKLFASNSSPNRDDVVCFWDIATGAEGRRIAESMVAMSDDRSLLATRAKDEFINVWDTATGRQLGKWPAKDVQPLAMSFSPNGRSSYEFLQDSSVDAKGNRREKTERRVVLREIATGKIVRQFTGHRFEDDRIYGVAFSPDGRLVAFSGQNSPVALYDMESGQQVKLLTGATKDRVAPTFASLTFSPDSRMLAGGEWNHGTVYLWELATGQEFQQFAGHKGRVFSMTFSPDGALLLSGNEDATGLIWDVTGQRARQNASPLSEQQLKAHWSELGSSEAIIAQRAIGALAARPVQALPLLQTLRPIPTEEPKRMERLFVQLDDDRFAERTAAVRELEELGHAAEQALRRRLEKSPSLETKRRIETLLKRLNQDPDRLRHLRILQLLEQSGTAETQRILRSLADGAAGAWLTKEAGAAMQRLSRGAGMMP